jgi:hypothetical protein
LALQQLLHGLHELGDSVGFCLFETQWVGPDLIGIWPDFMVFWRMDLIGLKPPCSVVHRCSVFFECLPCINMSLEILVYRR